METIHRKERYEISILYEKMKLKQISKTDWLYKTHNILESLVELQDKDYVIELFYAQLLITKNDIEDASIQLESVSTWLKDNAQEHPIHHAYYLYLNALICKDLEYNKRVILKLKEMVEKFPGMWQIGWLLFYIEQTVAEKDNMDLVKKNYMALKDMFLKGCRSPFLYLEARELLEINHTLIYQFSEFEIQTLLYMFRNKVISDSLVSVVSDFLIPFTTYQPSYVLLLKNCYKRMPSILILEAICRLLIEGKRIGEGEVKWYELGIEASLSLSGLYEYYLYSLPVNTWDLRKTEYITDKKIPISVLKYFTNSGTLEAKIKACLYAYIQKYRAYFLDIYKEYAPLIFPFTYAELLNNNISYSLAYLYEYILDNEILSEDYYTQFLQVCHTYKLRNLYPKQGVIRVKYINDNTEYTIPFEEGECFITVFGKKYELYLCDYEGKQTKLVEPIIDEFLNQEKHRELLDLIGKNHYLYQLSKVEKIDFDNLTPSNIDEIIFVLSMENITKNFKEHIIARTLPYLDMQEREEDIKEFLSYLSLDSDISKFFELQIWEKAKQNEKIGRHGIEFLIANFQGSVLEGIALFYKAREYDLDTRVFAVELLNKMIETNQTTLKYQDIFAYCLEQNVNKYVMVQFVEKKAEEGYKNGEVIADTIINCFVSYYFSGVEFNLLTKLWFVKECSKKSFNTLSEQKIDILKEILSFCSKEDIYLTYMCSFFDLCPQLRRKEAIQVLEYVGNPKEPISVTYAIGAQLEQEYKESDMMLEIYPGVYTKEFLLFYGERANYMIYGLQATEKILLQQGVLHNILTDTIKDKSRFTALNEIQKQREGKDREETYKVIEAYAKKNALVECFFKLK